MRRLLTIALAVSAVVLTVACKQKKDAGGKDVQTKTLVLYYSQTGTTQSVAEEISRLLGADIAQINVEEPYSGTYQQTIERCIKEREDSVKQKLAPIDADITAYDTVFIGYPVWFGTYAPPIDALVEVADFKGKTIVPFCTFGSGGLEPSTEDLRKALPEANVLDGYGVRTSRILAMPGEVERFLKSSGFLPGKVEPYPDFSASAPVTEEDVQVFNAACGDYQFPLGEPVSVSKRQIPEGTECKYTAKAKDRDGNASEFTIYVIKSDSPDTRPEFTRVVR